MEREIQRIEDIKEEVEYLIYSRDVVHAHSKAIQNFMDLYINHLDVAAEAQKAGTPVVIAAFVDLRFLYACDAIPIELPNIVRVNPLDTFKKSQERFQISAEVCPMAIGEIGGLYDFKDKFNRLLIGNFGCDMQFGVMTLSKQIGYDVFLFDETDHMADKTESGRRLAREKYREELEKQAKWLNGKGINKEKLSEELKRANRINDKYYKLEHLQRKHPTYMGCLPSMLLMSAGRGGYFGQPKAYEEAVDAIIAEFEALPEGSYNEKRPKIIWSGARGIDFSVFTAMDVLGAEIASWCMGANFYRKYDETIDPIEAFLDVVFNPGGSGGNNLISLGEGQLAEKLYNEMDADGVFIYMTQGCSHVSMNMEMRRRYLSEKGIPTLLLAGTSQTGEATGQLMTRIKAFIEMLS